MVQLNIDRITITPRYLISAIPEALERASCSEERDGAMKGADTLNGLLDGLWHQAFPFEKLSHHFGDTMAYLISEGDATEPVLVAFWLRWLRVVRFHTEHSARPPMKLAAGFIETLKKLPDEKRCVQRLWGAFSSALKDGFGNTLEKAEDQLGAELVAELLGAAMAHAKKMEDAGMLFNRARLGIEPGTSLYDGMSRHLIDAAAMASRAAQTRRG